MKRFKSLNGFQKGILIFMILMILVFTVLYYITIERPKVGYEYQGIILVPSQENGSTVYSGEIYGEKVCFTVYEDKSVVFQYGDETYGPYTAEEDPTAIPTDDIYAEYMTGVEIREGEEIVFRGGILYLSDYFELYEEDKIEEDQNADETDYIAPSAHTILELMNDPELTKNDPELTAEEHEEQTAQLLGWLMSVFICVVNAFTILFEDELYLYKMSILMRNADNVEPSDLEIAGRYVGYIMLTIMALMFFIIWLVL